MAKPITALELHYPVIHFLIIHIGWKIMGRESYAYDTYRESYIFETFLFRNSRYKFDRFGEFLKLNVFLRVLYCMIYDMKFLRQCCGSLVHFMKIFQIP